MIQFMYDYLVRQSLIDYIVFTPSFIDKVDGSSFTRSRSSSTSTVDMSSTESVTSVIFMDTYTKLKGNLDEVKWREVKRRRVCIFFFFFFFFAILIDGVSLVPSLWIGTSYGSVLTVHFNIPERDVRVSQSIPVSINGEYIEK